MLKNTKEDVKKAIKFLNIATALPEHFNIFLEIYSDLTTQNYLNLVKFVVENNIEHYINNNFYIIVKDILPYINKLKNVINDENELNELIENIKTAQELNFQYITIFQDGE